MKNKLRLVWALLFFSPGLIWSQQAANYSFSVSSSTYQELGPSANSLSAILADNASADVPIGFNFTFEGLSYDTVAVASDGFISFIKGATSTSGNDLDNGSSARRPLVAPLWDDHDGNANTSAALYETTGLAPNRVFTFEWRDWEWSWNASDSVVSFQVKLYESTNVVEFHYRWECSSCITGPDASIGLSGASSFLSVYDVGTANPKVSNSSEYASLDTVVTDQVYSFTPPACPAPVLDSIHNITTAGFDVYWSGVNGDDVIINWGPAGFNQATSTAQNLDTSNTGMYGISGLTAGALYDVYLQRICSGSNSQWLGPIKVQLPCLAQSLPYSEDFNGSLGCFTVADSAGSADTWAWTADYSGSDLDGNPGFAFVNSDAAGSTSMDEYLISPVIDASAITGSLILEFDQYYQWYSSDNGYVEVYDGTNWITVLSQNSTIGAWSNPDHQRIDLTAYANANLQVRFHYTAYYDWYWAVDNFSILEELCNTSSNLSLVTAFSDSITINWDPGQGTSFGIEYGPTGFSPGSGTFASTTDTFYTATGLSSNTLYDFYLTDTCSGGSFSQTIGPLIASTTCTSVSMPYVEDFEIWPLSCWDSTSSVSFNWEPSGSSPDRYALANFWSNSSGTAVISSRPITISQDAQVRFYWSHHYNTTYPDDQFIVRAKSLNGNATWDTILNLKGPSFDDPSAANTAAGSFIEEIILLDPAVYTGHDAVIELIGVTDYGPHLYVNDFNVEAVPPCPQVQGLRDSATTAWESILKWDDVSGNGSSYQVWFGPQGFYQGTQTTAGTQVLVSSDTLLVDTLSGLSCYEFLVRSICGPGDSSAWTGPYSFCTPPTCPDPSALNVSNSQLNQVDLDWTSGGASNFNLAIGAPGFSPAPANIVNVSTNTYTATSLMPGTTYEVYVRDSCGLGDVSDWVGPISFTTAYNTNFLDNFDAFSFNNGGWQEADGQLSSATNFTSTSSSSWGFDDYGNNTSNSSSQRVNIYFDGQYEWLISPSIYLDPAITNLQVEFDAAVTDYASTAQGYFGSDDSLALVISTDNGLTWSEANIIWVKTANDTIDNTGEHFTLPLTGYSGYVKFGFYAGSTIDDPEDTDWFIDNFEVRTPRACANPTGLAVNGISTTGAVGHWTPGSAVILSTDIILTTAGQSPANGTVLNPTAADSIIFSNLTPSTGYCFYIVEECANGFSDTIGPECFTTQCLPMTAPYSQNFDSAPAQDPFDGIPCWTVIGPGASDIELVDVPDFGVANAPSAPNAVELNDGDFNAGDTAILVSPTFSDLGTGLNRISFEVAFENTVESLFVGLLDNPYDAGSLRIVDTITTTTAGVYQSYTYDFDDPTLIGSAQNIALVHGTDIYEVYVDNFVYEAITVACQVPTALNVSATGCDTLTVDWTSNSGGSIIQYGPSGFTPGQGSFTGIVTSPFDITGLPLNTEFDVWVADTCGSDTSAYAGPFTLKTDSVGPIWASFTAQITNVTMTSADVSFDASASTNAVSYDWTFDNGSTGTGVNANTSYSANGTYNVTLTVTDRCGATDDTTLAVVVQGISLEEEMLNSKIGIYPNPNNGQFNLELPNTGSSFDLTVTDLAGKVIYEQADLRSDSEHQISLPSVAKGVYMVILRSEGKRISRRLIIE